MELSVATTLCKLVSWTRSTAGAGTHLLQSEQGGQTSVFFIGGSSEDGGGSGQSSGKQTVLPTSMTSLASVAGSCKLVMQSKEIDTFFSK